MPGSLMFPHRCPRTGRRVRQLPPDARFFGQRSELHLREPEVVSGIEKPSTQESAAFRDFRRFAAHRPADQPTSHDDRSRGCISRMIGHRPRLEHASLGEPAGSPPEQLRIESALRRTCIGFVVSPGRILDELRSATSELDRLGAVTSSFGAITSINLRKRTTAFQKDNSPVHK